MTRDRRLMAEWLGAFSLLATVLGSTIMAERLSGGKVGIVAAQVMFEHPRIHPSATARGDTGQWTGEFGAICGLVGTLLASLKARPQAVAMAVGLYITVARWFASSTSFAKPDVTIARGVSNILADIAPTNFAAFIGLQLLAAVLTAWLVGWMPEDPAHG